MNLKWFNCLIQDHFWAFCWGNQDDFYFSALYEKVLLPWSSCFPYWNSINRWIWLSVHGSTKTFIFKISWIVTNNFFPLLYMFFVPEVTLIHICCNCDIIHPPKYNPTPPNCECVSKLQFLLFLFVSDKIFLCGTES